MLSRYTARLRIIKLTGTSEASRIPIATGGEAFLAVETN